MPRKASGLPQWKSTAVKLPADLFEELRRYSDIQGVSLSDILREGLHLRLHGTTGAPETTRIAPPDIARGVAAQLRHLAALLDGQETSPVASAPAPARAQPAQADMAPEGYDPARFYLGRLCPRQHDYRGTGQSLLYRTKQSCYQCDLEQRRERRQRTAPAS